MIRFLLMGLLLIAVARLAAAEEAASPNAGHTGHDLQPPVQIEAEGQPLDVQRDGHSAPFFADFDGDGLRDLLVGQYHEGRLRIYRNLGVSSEPRFDTYTWFEAGGAAGRVPEG